MQQYYVITNVVDPGGQSWMTTNKMTAYQQINQLLVNDPNLWTDINHSKLCLYLDQIDNNFTAQNHQLLLKIDRATLEQIQKQIQQLTDL